MLSTKQRSHAQALLENALADDPTVTLRAAPGGGMELETGHNRLRLVLRADGKVATEPSPDPRVRVVYVLEGSTADQRARLRNGDVSFVDVSRRIVRLSAPGILIDRTDLESPAAKRQPDGRARNPFSDRASLITRALLEHPDWDWSLEKMATYVHLSSSMVSRVLKQLRALHVVEAPDTRRHPLRFRLADPWPLFLTWTAHYSWADNALVSVAAPIGDVASSLDRIAQSLSSLRPRPRWAFALQAAASLISPHASWDTVHVYLGVRDSSELLDVALRLRWPVSEQGRLVLMAPHYRQSVWWRAPHPHEGLPTVSIIQMLVDLWHYPVRGREQAEHLSRRMKWPPREKADG